MWGLVLFALLSFHASALSPDSNQRVLTTLEELVILSTIPSPSYVGQPVTFYVERVDGEPFDTGETFEWQRNGQVVSNLENYTMEGDLGTYNLTVSLSVAHLVAFAQFVVGEKPLVIVTTVPPPCPVGKVVTFEVHRSSGEPFAADESYKWSLDGTVVSEEPDYTMTATLGTHNITVALAVAQLVATTVYDVIKPANVLALKIATEIQTEGILTIETDFQPANTDIQGNLTFWLNELKIAVIPFTGPHYTYTKTLPLPMSKSTAWFHATYSGSAIYGAAASNYIQIMANGTTLDDVNALPGAVGPSVGASSNSSTEAKDNSSSTSLSQTNIILIAIAGSIVFFVCCVFIIARRNSNDAVIHEPLANE